MVFYNPFSDQANIIKIHKCVEESQDGFDAVLALVRLIREIMMQRRLSYQQRLLNTVEAFLEGIPGAQTQAHDSIQRWVAEIGSSTGSLTLDEILWGSDVIALTDSIYYESEEYLRNIRELLLGRPSRNSFTAVFTEDYRPYFTPDEAEWYEHLLGMVDFLTTIPFPRLHEAIYPAFHNKERWETILERIPEAAQVEKLEQDYEQRKARLEEISARNPVPENVGEESIYHFVLREVTSIFAEIWIVPAAAYVGYPILGGTHSNIRGAGQDQYPNMTEHITWAKRVLRTLSYEGGELIFSWRLHKSSPPNADVLFISLH